MAAVDRTDLNKLRVVVVDDSSFNRKTITDMLESTADIEVVGCAADGEQGLKVVSEKRPDLVTLDLEMPRMDGFTFLRVVMSQMPTPVIVVSSHSRKQEVFQALELGALDFIAKPARFVTRDMDALREEIMGKALAVRALQRVPFSRQGAPTGDPSGSSAVGVGLRNELGAQAPDARDLKRIVCIGASTGGPPALQSMFTALGSGGPAAYMVAQHMPEKFTQAFAERLDRRTALTIREARHAEVVLPGNVYIAPGGAHLEIEPDGTKYRTRIRAVEPDDHYIPCIDRLFMSAAECFEGPLLAVVLTGMGYDGAQGVQAVKAAGGRVIAESKETAIVYGMPQEAVATGCVTETLPLGRVIESVHRFALVGLEPSGNAA